MQPTQPLFPKETTVTDRTENDALIEHITANLAPRVQEVTRGTPDLAQVLVVPKGMQTLRVKELLDAYLPAPERRTGTTQLADVESFSAYVNRHKRPETVIFADLDANGSPSLECVFDADHEGPEGAGWCQHRATYAFPLSSEWVAWRRAHGQQLAQSDFASFIDERAADLLDAEALRAQAQAVAAQEGTPYEEPAQIALAARLGVPLASAAEVIGASRGLRIRAEVNVAEVVTVGTGETELVFSEQHRGADGNSLKVPSAFLVGIPVFRDEPRDVFLARLRYRRAPQAARILWTLSLHQVDDVLRAACREVVKRVRGATSLPVFTGSAPKAR